MHGTSSNTDAQPRPINLVDPISVVRS